MGFLKNIIRNAVDDGISKGIRDAVSTATEKIVAPKAEAYANKMAETLSNAADEADAAAACAGAAEEKKGGFASLQASLEKLSQSAEKYAETMEKAAAEQEDLTKLWNEKVPDFPVWCFGGTDFWFSDIETTEEGAAYYWFNADNATQEGLDLYIALLKKSGFVRKYSTSDEVLYKDLGGTYLLFGITDAFGTAPVMSVSMGRTKDKSAIEC